MYVCISHAIWSLELQDLRFVVTPTQSNLFAVAHLHRQVETIRSVLGLRPEKLLHGLGIYFRVGQ